MLGLSGSAPDTVVPEDIESTIEQIKSTGQLKLWGEHGIAFYPEKALSYLIRHMVEHPNGMRFSAFGTQRKPISVERYVSLVGGFILALDDNATDESVTHYEHIPDPFVTGQIIVGFLPYPEKVRFRKKDGWMCRT